MVRGEPVADWLNTPGQKAGFPVSFSADGTLLATSDALETVRLWDVARRSPLGDPLVSDSYRRLNPPLTPPTDVEGLAFSPDGKTLAASYFKTVWLWDVDPDSWAVRLCRLANRNLSLDEWQQYVGVTVPYHRTCPNVRD